MINQEFKAQGAKVAGSEGYSKLQVFAHACAVSALSSCYGISALQLINLFIIASIFGSDE